jgi:hypothetical protein
LKTAPPAPGKVFVDGNNRRTRPRAPASRTFAMSTQLKAAPGVDPQYEVIWALACPACTSSIACASWA